MCRRRLPLIVLASMSLEGWLATASIEILRRTSAGQNRYRRAASNSRGYYAWRAIRSLRALCQGDSPDTAGGPRRFRDRCGCPVLGGLRFREHFVRGCRRHLRRRRLHSIEPESVRRRAAMRGQGRRLSSGRREVRGQRGGCLALLLPSRAPGALLGQDEHEGGTTPVQAPISNSGSPVDPITVSLACRPTEVRFAPPPPAQRA
jgi:hypothetical protein